jgi:uncharacterized protein (DUF2225 family)
MFLYAGARTIDRERRASPVTTLLDKELVCPCCGHNFKTSVVGSTNIVGYTTDFYPITRGLQPMQYGVYTCPSCGYSASYGGYGDTSLSERVKTLIKEELAPIIQSGPISAGQRWEFAARIAGWQDAPHQEIGDLYLRAAWCSAGYRRVEEERGYRRQAIEHFEKALQAGEIPAGEAVHYAYLTGELYRRVGDQENAHRWFDRVAEIAGQDPKNRRYVELARQQRTNPKETL